MVTRAGPRKFAARPQPPIRLEADYGAVLMARMQLAHHAAIAAIHAGKDPTHASRDAMEAAPMPRARLRKLVAQVDGHAALQMRRAGLPEPKRAAGSSLQGHGSLRADEKPQRAPRPKPPPPSMRQGVSDADVERFVRENVDLITGLQDRWYDDVAKVVLQSQRENWPREQLEKAIAREAGVSRSRAKFIGRDQVAKLNGRIVQARQEGVGVRSYRWSTSRDERVRPSHRALEGQVFRWDQPPGIGHPGHDFGCRCVAIPELTLDDI